MNRLTIKECQLFFEYFYKNFMEFGYLKPLREFSEKNETTVAEAVLCWYNAMLEGDKSPQQALRHMKPRFPSIIEDLLCIGIDEADLDWILPAIVHVYQKFDTEEKLSEGMFNLLKEYEEKEYSDFISDEYFILEFCRIMCRGNHENAEVIILEQDDNNFLHIRMEGFRPIHYIEACHRKIYTTTLNNLKQISKMHITLDIRQDSFHVEEIGLLEFRLTGKERSVIVKFR